MAEAEVKETASLEEVLRDPKYTKEFFTFKVNLQEWFVLERTLCYIVSMDEQLKNEPDRKGPVIRMWRNDEEIADLCYKIARRLLERIMLLPRRSSIGYAAYLARYGIKYDFRHADYRERGWHHGAEERR